MEQLPFERELCIQYDKAMILHYKTCSLFHKKNQYYRQSFQIIIEYRSTSRLLQVDYMFIVTIETNTGTAACSTINKETKIFRIFFRSYIQKSNFINSYRFNQKKNVSIYKIFFIAIRTCTFVKS